MRESKDAFHLAIPAADLDEAFAFYVTGLGCKLARRATSGSPSVTRMTGVAS
jgi:extradiol dioxygenase family protein